MTASSAARPSPRPSLAPHWLEALAVIPLDFEFHPDPSVPDWRILRDRTSLIDLAEIARRGFGALNLMRYELLRF